MDHPGPANPTELAQHIKALGLGLGFTQIGIAAPDVGLAEARLQRWLDEGRHGEMAWMAAHGTKRSRPSELEPGTRSVIVARLDYWPDAMPAEQVLEDPQRAYVSRYALGRDYHRLVRMRLQRLADQVQAVIGPFGYRAYCDSAPVMEKPLAVEAGIGWQGKHTNVLTRSGSWFFLGEIYTDLALPADGPVEDGCGGCQACIRACPTGAITAPYQLDARRCISYLTIEHPGPIPEPLRPAMGNRIYGCDDCQLVCPWNRHAQPARETGFAPRHGLDSAALVELMNWSETEFQQRMQGSAIRRIGHVRWQRNLAVALGNVPPGNPVVRACLEQHLTSPSELVREHVRWAIARQDGEGTAKP